MSRTIANTLSTGITLSPGDNPVSITAAGRITAASGDAVYGYIPRSCQDPKILGRNDAEVV
jgi:hypothetical protein